MTTIRDYLNKARFVRDNILSQTENIIYNNENKIVQLNTSQFDKGKGSDGNVIKNSNPLFDGTYSILTNLLNPSKKAGSLYDFNNTGDFLNGMQIEVNASISKIKIFSTGTGSGDKSVFFSGYTNLFGLDNKNTEYLNDKIIMPELKKFINQYL